MVSSYEVPLSLLNGRVSRSGKLPMILSVSWTFLWNSSRLWVRCRFRVGFKEGWYFTNRQVKPVCNVVTSKSSNPLPLGEESRGPFYRDTVEDHEILRPRPGSRSFHHSG